MLISYFTSIRSLSMRNTLVLMLLGLLSVCSASAQFFSVGPGKTAQLTINHPPEFGLTVKRVAFGQPEGSCSTEATELVDRMILPDFQQQGMDVIERQALDQIMAEHNFSQSAYADAGSAARLGKILGPSALVIVTVDNCSAEKLPLYNDQKNFNGAVVRTYISKTRFSLEGSVRVVNLTTGQILGSHNFESKPEKINQSQGGPPEFPPVDEVKDSAMQAVKFQVHAMFFPSGDTVSLPFYGDKDCDLNQVYQLYKNGDKAGAVRMMDSNLELCKSGHHKGKTLARADYDAGLLHCIQKDYDKANALFTSAMDSKGADAVASASSNCNRAREGASQLKAYEARVAQIPPPMPIAAGADTPQASGATGSIPKSAKNVVHPSASSTSATGTVTVEQRLKELDGLYKRGLINRKEYDAKKAEILKAL